MIEYKFLQSDSICGCYLLIEIDHDNLNWVSCETVMPNNIELNFCNYAPKCNEHPKYRELQGALYLAIDMIEDME